MTLKLSEYEVECPFCGKAKSKFGKCFNCPTGVGVLYRYEDSLADEYPNVNLREFKVAFETPHVWFVELWDGHRHCKDVPLKRVYKDSRKSFAYPTIELARNSYGIRKRRQLGHLSRQRDHVAAIVARLDAGTAWEPLEFKDPFADFAFGKECL